MELRLPSRIGNWKKISNLGEGSFGVVTLWKREDCDEFIAVKQCKKSLPSSVTPKQKERWINEVDVMKSLDHPNIISYKPLPEVLDIELNKWNPTKLPILSMEYCSKGNLRHLLRQYKNTYGLSETEVRYIIEDIANAVAYLHKRNITHRDIKPENIVLQNIHYRKGNIIYKLIDLGYAKELDETTVSFVGTFHYLAPEIFKNQMYNFEVDYWSLGVLIYEIISGTLPFSIHLTPFEWYKSLSMKGPQDIAIIKHPKGEIKYSSEIKNFKITKCLKYNFELWLQHALQFNPNIRKAKFANNLTVLDCLQTILNKNIVNVFSLYTYEFFSYEIDDTTLITTLKEWIENDTKIAVDDQLLLSNERIYESDNEKCVYEVINRDNKDLYVLKKGELKSNSSYIFPELIKILLTKPSVQLKWKTELRQIFIYALNFITDEEKSMQAFAQGFKLYMEYTDVMVKKVEKEKNLANTNFNNLIIKIQCYSNFTKLVSNDDKFCDKNESLEDCLYTFQRLFASIERNKTRLDELNQNILKLLKKNNILNSNKEEINTILNKDFQDLFERANSLIVKYEGQSEELQIGAEMSKIIGQLLKRKEKLFAHTIIVKHSEASSIILRKASDLMEWMNDFNRNIQELSNALDMNECKRYKIMIEIAAEAKEKPPPRKVINGMCSIQDVPVDILIKENQSMRYNIDDLMTQSLMDHKQFCDEACTFLNKQF